MKTMVIRIEEDAYLRLKVKQTELLIDKGIHLGIQNLASGAIKIGLQHLDDRQTIQTELDSFGINEY